MTEPQNEKILKINLDEKSFSFEQIPDELLCKFLGGRGLAGEFMQSAAALGWDDPAAPILIFSGLLGGSGLPFSGRASVMALSALTGTVADDLAPGSLSIHLKKSGISGIIITGKSDIVSGIEIEDDEVRFVNASFLEKFDAVSAHDNLKDKGATLITGPAARSGALYAGVLYDGRILSRRGGIGAAFGAKNIRFISVRGTSTPEPADNDEFVKAKCDILRLSSASTALRGESGISAHGTGALFDLLHSRRMMPTSNFRRTFFPPAATMNAPAYERYYTSSATGCEDCEVSCCRISQDGKILPDGEAMVLFGPLLENENIELVSEAHTACLRLGLEARSAAGTLATYAEITGKKLSGEKILQLLKDIASGTGEGAELAKGSYRYAQNCARPEASISIKKQELPPLDPRGAYGMALSMAIATCGAENERARAVSHEILRKPVATDRFGFSGKARIIKIGEDGAAVADALGICPNIMLAASLEEYGKALVAYTGRPELAAELMTVGERICYRERIFNSLRGFTADDDILPQRFFTEPGTGGNGIDVPPINKETFLATRASYYKVRCLDENGLPLREKAEELGLTWND